MPNVFVKYDVETLEKILNFFKKRMTSKSIEITKRVTWKQYKHSARIILAFTIIDAGKGGKIPGKSS